MADFVSNISDTLPRPDEFPVPPAALHENWHSGFPLPPVPPGAPLHSVVPPAILAVQDYDSAARHCYTAHKNYESLYALHKAHRWDPNGAHQAAAAMKNLMDAHGSACQNLRRAVRMTSDFVAETGDPARKDPMLKEQRDWVVGFRPNVIRRLEKYMTDRRFLMLHENTARDVQHYVETGQYPVRRLNSLDPQSMPLQGLPLAVPHQSALFTPAAAQGVQPSYEAPGAGWDFGGWISPRVVPSGPPLPGSRSAPLSSNPNQRTPRPITSHQPDTPKAKQVSRTRRYEGSE